MVDLILFEALACEAFEEVRDTGSAFAGKFRCLVEGKRL